MVRIAQVSLTLPTRNTKSLTFGELKIGESFLLEVLYAQRTATGTKVDAEHAKFKGLRGKTWVGKMNEVKRVA